ncbi:1-acyl-sn-glycerol-3-phosphate acyltransferase [mine drainage metagenome]|jgi:1-acyl-sn-glycerol-3-phosphate acyltransferase|uniref:1-acyl-sn-glycerol-3-phosphate acyltransferase n=1 Tax=mine drainage metagenome TaxID=410659 RepID=A0A1J5QNE2_9ZZZZ
MMLWLRSAAYMAWLVLSVIPYAIAVLLLSPFVRGRTLYRFCVGWVSFALWGAQVVCGIRRRVHGMENLPDGPLILLPKHQSAWETLALPVLMPRPLSYVFKRELLFVPFFGWALGRLDMVHIDRTRGTEAFGRVAEQGAELLRKGYWIIMFPEGTRTARGRKGSYKLGGARLAVMTDTPVVPIAITSARCWPRQAFIKRPGVIDVSIGQPIAPAGRSAAELMQLVEDWVEAEMHRLDADAYRR